MNVYEITEAKASSLLFYVAQSRRELAKESLREVIAFAVEEGRKEGAQAACSWLEEVYGEGIRGTDAWNTYMKEEAK